jgi:amino acid permease
MVEACVCVVNSAARAAVSLAITTLLGALLGIESLSNGRVSRVMNLAQVISFAAALFFLIQHVFFVLQLA